MSKSTTPSGASPKQSDIGRMINDLFELNKSESIANISAARRDLGLDDVTASRIAEIVGNTCDKNRGLALDQLVRLYK